MSEQRIALCLIVGDQFDEGEIDLLFESVQPHVHHVFIAFNGTKEIPDFGKYATPGMGVTVQRFEWMEDFALARNQSFSLVPRDEYDWYLWLDTDDILVVEHEDGLQGVLASLDPYTSAIMARYDYAIEPDTGSVVVVQWRERLLKTDTDWKWEFPIHEVCKAPPGTQFAKRDGFHVEHLRKSGEDRGARERNRSIIARGLKDHPNEPRYRFYFAGESMAEADSMPPGRERNEIIDAAILAYRQFMGMAAVQTDDVYLASTRVGDLFMMKGAHNEAIDAFLQSIKLYPMWPQGYIGVAKACLEIGDYPRQKDFAHVACLLPVPETAASIEALDTGWTQHLLRGIASEELAEYQQALEDYRYCIEIHDPPEGVLKERIERVSGLLDSGAAGEDQWSERKKLRGTKPEKSIAFVTNALPEYWHPDIEKQEGAGGAETCIMRLAPRFASDGWRVAVFGTPGPEHRGVDSDGVEWWNADEFLPNEEFTVLVGSRTPQIFAGELAAKTSVLWMHDVNVGPVFDRMTVPPDKVIGLTDWHINHMSRLYDWPIDKFAVVPNGIELDLFSGADDKDLKPDSPRFIYSSSPDRGLESLLGMWPMIKGSWPGARLDVFYGWNMIDKIIAYGGPNGEHMASFKNQIFSNVAYLGGEDAGLYFHDRVSQSELAQWQGAADFWLYPTEFMETFCITAVEMQAAGVIPITSDLAGLSETVALSWLRIAGWPKNSDYQTRWFRVLDSMLEDSEQGRLLRDQARRLGRKHAEQYTWDNAYAKWNELFAELGVARV